MHYNTENWHALSHEQYFSTHQFLDIGPKVFKYWQYFVAAGKYHMIWVI